METYIKSENDNNEAKIDLCSQKDHMTGENAHPIKGSIYTAFEGRTGRSADRMHNKLKEYKLPDNF